jgi:hypothetical protein
MREGKLGKSRIIIKLKITVGGKNIKYIVKIEHNTNKCELEIYHKSESKL